MSYVVEDEGMGCVSNRVSSVREYMNTLFTLSLTYTH